MTTESSELSNDVEIFRQLESYPWDKDKEFQGGLSAILGPNPSPSQVQDLTLRAQCFYLSRKKGIPIDFDAYKSYLSSSSTAAGQPATESNTAGSSSTFNPPQTSNSPISSGTYPPRYTRPLRTSADLLADLPAASSITSAPPRRPSTQEDDLPTDPNKSAPYPQTFAEIVALITSGAPIPGIKEIPDTVLSDHVSVPVLRKRRKPWEKDVPEEVIQGNGPGTFGDHRDHVIPQEFPEDV